MDTQLSAFEVLYKNHYSGLTRAATNIISDKDEAHDIVQETFLKLWQRKDELQHILNHKAYLFRSVINASLYHLEKRKPLVRLEKIQVEPHEKSTGVDSKELEAKISFALEKLPPQCKTIFVLSRFEEMKYREIADYLGISVNTVENQMGIALKKLRAELSVYLTREFMALAIGTGCAVMLRYILMN